MTLILSSSIQVPNLTRVKIRSPQFDDYRDEFRAIAEVQGVGGRVYELFTVTVRNDGMNRGIATTAAPVRYNDFIEYIDVPASGNYDGVVSAFTGANLAAKMRSVETYLMNNGILNFSGSIS